MRLLVSKDTVLLDIVRYSWYPSPRVDEIRNLNCQILEVTGKEEYGFAHTEHSWYLSSSVGGLSNLYRQILKVIAQWEYGLANNAGIQDEKFIQYIEGIEYIEKIEEIELHIHKICLYL